MSSPVPAWWPAARHRHRAGAPRRAGHPRLPRQLQRPGAARLRPTRARRTHVARPSVPLSTRPATAGAASRCPPRDHAPAAAPEPEHSASKGDRDGHARLRDPRGGHYPVSRLAAVGKTSSWPPGSRPARRLSFLWPAPLHLLVDREPAAPPAASGAAGDRRPTLAFAPSSRSSWVPHLGPASGFAGEAGPGRTWPDPGRPRGVTLLAATRLIRAPSRSPVRRPGGPGRRAAGLVRVRRRP